MLTKFNLIPVYLRKNIKSPKKLFIFVFINVKTYFKLGVINVIWLTLIIEPVLKQTMTPVKQNSCSFAINNNKFYASLKFLLYGKRKMDFPESSITFMNKDFHVTARKIQNYLNKLGWKVVCT